ncbi:MAG: sugar ABC transporter substrate-binding protein [Chloroflexi bacterium]|nr:sugar ABC transporter substrate-binding protein [Chloroflexota bacterium]
MNRNVLPRPAWLGLMLSVVLVSGACGSNQGGQASPAASGGFGTPAPASAEATAEATTAEETTAAETSEATPGATTEASAEGSAGTGTASGEIGVWAMGEEGKALGDFAAAYTEENPDATVDVEPIDWGIARDRLLTAIGGNQTPDTSQMGTDMMGEFIETGALEPVPADVDTGRFFPGALNTGLAPDGNLYSVPWYVETRVLYYRTDLAEAAGITEAPKTWEELKAMAVALKEGGAEWGISLGTKNWQEYLPFVWTNGGDVVGEDGEFALNSPEAVEALEFYDSFFEEELSPTQAPENFQVEAGFVQGTHPMFFSGPWHLKLIEDAGGADFEGKWAIAPMPSKDGEGIGTSFVGGGNFVVYADSENKDLAWNFVDWLTRPETQVAWYEEVAALPSDTSAWQDEALAGDENLAIFGEQLQSAKAQPAIPTWGEVGENALNGVLEQVTVGDVTAQEGAEAMQQEAESIGTGAE